MIINNHKIAPGANLTGANLTGVHLINANLKLANLTGANLAWASLTDANLTYVHLTNAALTHANLTGANLAGANLAGANLAGTILNNTNLTDANLNGTCLDPKATVPELSDEEILRAGLRIEGDLVYGWRTKISIHCGRTQYEPGKCYEAPWFSVCQETSCHPGIYLASKEWLNREYGVWLDYEYGVYSHVRCYCRRDELMHVGDKWRCKRLWVV